MSMLCHFSMDQSFIGAKKDEQKIFFGSSWGGYLNELTFESRPRWSPITVKTHAQDSS